MKITTVEHSPQVKIKNRGPPCNSFPFRKTDSSPALAFCLCEAFKTVVFKSYMASSHINTHRPIVEQCARNEVVTRVESEEQLRQALHQGGVHYCPSDSPLVMEEVLVASHPTFLLLSRGISTG